MREKILLVVGITILFLGVGIQPAFATIQPENIDFKYYDVTTEFVGLGKEHTVKLTQQQLDELEALFEKIREQLNNAKTMEESIQIFNRVIVELDSFGLLGDVGIKKSEKLVTSYYQNPKLIKILERAYIRKNGALSEDVNNFCLIFGITSGLIFASTIAYLLTRFLLLAGLIPPTGDLLLDIIMLMLMIFVPTFFIPFCLGRMIGTNFTGSNGSGLIVTFGLNGLKYWNGKLKGMIKGFFEDIDVGVLGFTGLKIEIVTRPKQYFFGFAIRVHIEDS